MADRFPSRRIIWIEKHIYKDKTNVRTNYQINSYIDQEWHKVLQKRPQPDIENPRCGWGQAQKYDSVKPIDEIPTLPLDIYYFLNNLKLWYTADTQTVTVYSWNKKSFSLEKVIFSACTQNNKRV